MQRDELTRALNGGVFLSSMMKITDGRWVADRAEGTCMVQIGALIADLTDRSHPDPELLPLTEAEMVPVLKSHVDVIREAWGSLPIGLNAAPGDLESALRMARAFGEAGGDIFELNCHGGYGKLLKRGLLKAMMLPDQRPVLLEWLEALCTLPIPVVVKFNGTLKDIDFRELLSSISGIERLFGVHFNIRDVERKRPNMDLVRRIRPLVPGVLFCSGYVTTRAQVTELTEAGVDCVGVAQGFKDDSRIMEHLQ